MAIIESGVYAEQGITVDFNRWKNRDLREFQAKTSAEKPQDSELFPLFAKCVVAWPWPELNPAKAEDYDELSIIQWRTVVEVVLKALGEIFQFNRAGNVSGA